MTLVLWPGLVSDFLYSDVSLLKLQTALWGPWVHHWALIALTSLGPSQIHSLLLASGTAFKVRPGHLVLAWTMLLVYLSQVLPLALFSPWTLTYFVGSLLWVLSPADPCCSLASSPVSVSISCCSWSDSWDGPWTWFITSLVWDYQWTLLSAHYSAHPIQICRNSAWLVRTLYHDHHWLLIHLPFYSSLALAAPWHA